MTEEKKDETQETKTEKAKTQETGASVEPAKEEPRKLPSLKQAKIKVDAKSPAAVGFKETDEEPDEGGPDLAEIDKTMKGAEDSANAETPEKTETVPRPRTEEKTEQKEPAPPKTPEPERTIQKTERGPVELTEEEKKGKTEDQLDQLYLRKQRKLDEVARLRAQDKSGALTEDDEADVLMEHAQLVSEYGVTDMGLAYRLVRERKLSNPEAQQAERETKKVAASTGVPSGIGSISDPASDPSSKEGQGGKDPLLADLEANWDKIKRSW